MIRTLVAAAVLSPPRVDQSAWAHPDHLDHLAARNAQATHAEMEWE